MRGGAPAHLAPIVLLTLLGLATGCSPEPVQVTYAGVSGQTARFVVENRSAQDVMSISFEIDFREPSGAPAALDTMAFRATVEAASGDTIPFVRAGDETFFNAQLPAGSVSATVATGSEIT